MSNTPPLLGNSKQLGAVAGRFALQLQSGFGGNWQVAQAGAVQLVAWQTLQNEPQELELLVYPESQFEGSSFADDANVTDRVRLLLTRGVGAQGAEGNAGTGYDTLLGLPANGLRYRFAAKSAVVKAFTVSANGFNVTLRAALYPVAGDSAQECCVESRDPIFVPKGARSFRCVPGYKESTAKITFYAFGGTEVIMTAGVEGFLAWTSLPRGAWWFSTNTSWGGPGSGETEIGYGISTFFR